MNNTINVQSRRSGRTARQRAAEVSNILTGESVPDLTTARVTNPSPALNTFRYPNISREDIEAISNRLTNEAPPFQIYGGRETLNAFDNALRNQASTLLGVDISRETTSAVDELRPAVDEYERVTNRIQRTVANYPSNNNEEEVYMANMVVNPEIINSPERERELHKQLAMRIINEMPYEEFKKLFKLTKENESVRHNNTVNYRVRFKTIKRRLR